MVRRHRRLPGRSDPAAAMTDVRTLGEIEARRSMLTVACSRCERRGRYRLDALIGRHGAHASARVTVPELTADCTQWRSAALMELCDILFPGLRALFPAASQRDLV
jgi:hypothetical protein